MALNDYRARAKIGNRMNIENQTGGLTTDTLNKGLAARNKSQAANKKAGLYSVIKPGPSGAIADRLRARREAAESIPK